MVKNYCLFLVNLSIMNIKNPFISIIVPIYNVEPYLAKCIESLLNQSYSNYEIILVNDGSPDNCGKICDQYSSTSDKIRVLHLENGGVCRARNKGMEIANGEYFCFVDSDDWVETDYLKDFVDNLVDEYSVVVQDAYRDLPDKTQPNFFNFKYREYKLSQLEDLLSLFREGFFQEGYPWNKIYSKKIIQDNNLQFDPNIKLGDDEKWNLLYYKYIKEFIFIDKSNYHYLYNPNSISNQSRPFDRELLRLQFRTNYFNFILSKHNKPLLRKELEKIVDVFFRLNIFDRIYKFDNDRKTRIEKLNQISDLGENNLKFLKSPLFFRNLDYTLLRNKNNKLMDYFKMMRLK